MEIKENLNTSHVLIYHVSGLFNIPNNTDLNTSHVLIYRRWE